MNYSIDPSSWGAVFAVPTKIVDDYIRLAGAVQLKALFWMYRHSADGIDIDKMSKDLGLSRPDLEDALQFWVECGIINADNSPPPQKEPPKSISEKPEQTAKKSLPDIPYIKPNMEQIIARGNENPEIKYMFSEVQQRLGRTIGHDGQSTLLMMHDRYGLPIEVILMLVQYCSSIGKDSFSYIAKVGRDWGEKEIDTIEKADEQITSLKTSNKLFSQLRELTGITNPKPTSVQITFLNAWKNELNYDIEIISLAYEEMANNCTRLSFPYMDKVLRNWSQKGVKSAEDIENLKKKKSEANSKKSVYDKKTAASYDIDEFTKRALGNPLIYRKKECSD